MSIKAILLNLKIGHKLNLIFGIFLLFALISLYILYKSQVNKILSDTNGFMMESLSDITEMMALADSHSGNVGFSKEDYDLLKPFFDKKKYYETGYPFLVSINGDFLIHPWKEGTNELRSDNHQTRLSYGEGEGYFRYNFSLDGKPKWQYVIYFKPYDAYVTATFYEYELFRELSKIRILFAVFIVLSISLMLLLRYFNKFLGNALKRGVIFAEKASRGQLGESLNIQQNDEIGQMVSALNKLQEGLKSYASIAQKIGEGILDEEYTVIGEDDILGNSMLKMRDSLKFAAEEEKKRKQEDEERNWVAMGLAKFGDILRTNYQSTKDLGEIVIQNLVKYLDANQGGIFQVNDDNESEKHLELLSAFAYDRKKYLTKKIMIGEGLVGACAIEKKSIYMTQVPQGYISITSGLGDANPDCLLIVPMRLEEKVFGVIEIASFRKLEKYEIEFVEKVAESIASTISTVKINARTTFLLQQSQQQAEEMAAQEEEMRQNMEELQATQEESARREFELVNLINSIDKHFLRSEYSTEGVIVSANDLFINSLGFSLSELKSKNVVNVINSENEEDFTRNWKSICSGKDFQGVVSVSTKSGDLLWFLMSFSPVYDQNGDLIKILGFAKSISNLKEDEIELKRQLMHFEEMKTDWQKTIRESRKK